MTSMNKNVILSMIFFLMLPVLTTATWFDFDYTSGKYHYNMTLYNNSIIDDVWGDNLMRPTGGVQDSSYPVFGVSGNGTPKSIYFNGSGPGGYNFANFSDFNYSINFTLNVWLFLQDNSVNDQTIFVHREGSGANDDRFQAYCSGGFSSGNVNIILNDGINGFKGLNTGYACNQLKGWHMFTIAIRDTGANSDIKFYINGTSQANFSNNFNTADLNIIGGQEADLLFFGYSFTNAINMKGYIDHLKFYHRYLEPDEIYSLWETGDIEEPANNTIDIRFSNDTIYRNQDNFFNEGEDFYIFLNYSDNTLNPINGSCNITLENGIINKNSLYDNFTVCLSGCNFTSYNESFDTDSINSAKVDYVHFNVCHEQLTQNDLLVNVSCGDNGWDSYTIDNALFPICSAGSQNFFINFSHCLNKTELNVTLSNNAINTRRHRITNLNVDREFFNHTNIWGEDVFYNSTGGFYYTNHSHEYYVHGTYNVSANCSEGTTLTLHSEDITIENVPPVIVFSTVTTSLNQTLLFNGTVIEFANGTFSFSGAIIDDDLDTLNVTFYNSTGQVIYTVQTDQYIQNINLSSDYFINFDGNPFNLTVWVNDTYGNTTTESILFTVGDTISPVCTGFDNATVTFNTTYSWNATCTDENFYSLNVSCNNSFNYFRENINSTTFNFLNSTLADDNISCYVEYCDAHTAEKLSNDFSFSTKDKSLTAGTSQGLVLFNYTGAYDVEIITEKLYDRVKFKIDYKDKSDTKLKTYHFRYRGSDQTEIIESDLYPAWIVDYKSRTWFDLANDGGYDINVIPVKKDEGIYDITVTTTATELEFNSIGELNCYNTTQIISLSYPVTQVNATLVTGQCPDNITDGILLLGIIFFGLVVLYIGMTYNVGFFIMFSGIIFFVSGWVYTGCHTLLGSVLFLFGIVLLIYSVLRGVFLGLGKK